MRKTSNTFLLSLSICYGWAACYIMLPGRGGGIISDPNVVFQALGVTVDMTSRTMGVRTRRFAMYVDDGEVHSQASFWDVACFSHVFSEKMYLISSC